ncbi:MAG: Vitamin K epoxide reductase [Candidatus Wolfebacteria bacterium GW2011_GWC2_39_22]|uniref:Vitamin K epoxide reductase n=1 Tax=Candidatus Wolfebacteria bacterium GW2011_GWC2_39_22 TaxID=1619013 RepID=A0A0G0N7Q4_9BACT|nr:MAG: Vitamin K epoxide reductase [Candidatus Wolfebacteria bacterium GW2011_GWC2_39_22]HBI25202.1 hypothetical protein [Candidatus Wolfebacteria bacterium]
MDTSKNNTIIVWTILALSVAGFTDAVYLAMKRIIGSPINCFAFSGCDTVAQSTYSAIFGIPLSLLGAIFYAVTIILITYYLQRRTKKGLQRVLAMAILGGVFALYLFALQAFVIKAWCLYCVISDTIGVVTALLAIYLWRKEK